MEEERKPTAAEVLEASIRTFMLAMPDNFVGQSWDGYTIKFLARRENEMTQIQSLTMARGKLRD